MQCKRYSIKNGDREEVRKIYKPKITLEIQGIENVQKLIEISREQINELEATIGHIQAETLYIQAKINQPSSIDGDS